MKQYTYFYVLTMSLISEETELNNLCTSASANTFEMKGSYLRGDRQHCFPWEKRRTLHSVKWRRLWISSVLLIQRHGDTPAHIKGIGAARIIPKDSWQSEAVLVWGNICALRVI
jgi:hypothetical protein